MPHDFRLIVDKLHDGVALVDASARIQFATQTLLGFLGSAESGVLGMDLFSFVHEDERVAARTAFAACTAAPDGESSFSARVHRGDQTWCPVDCRLANHLGRPGIDAVLVSVRDTSGGRESVVAHERAEERLRLVADATGLAAFEYDPVARTFEGCPTFSTIAGFEGRTDPIPLPEFLAVIEARDRGPFKEWLAQADGGREQIEFDIKTPAGTRSMSCRARTMTALSGAKHVYGVLVDITVHKEVQQRRDHEHVRQHEARRLRDFVAAMVAAQEEERRRVARELHDELAQQLVALMLGLETLRAESQGRPRALSRVEQLHEAAERLGRDVHRIAVELRPTALDDHGLRRALTTHAQRWSERFGIPVDLRLEDIETMRLPPDFETALFRIVQEALTNIARHAQAHHVTVTLTFASGQIVATIADDGVGFDATSPWTNAAVRERLGLLSMRERAVLIGGELAIDSVPDKGTVIVVRAPVERTQDSPDRLSGEP